MQLRHTYLSAEPPCLEYEFVAGGDFGGMILEWHKVKKGPSPTEAARVVLRLAEIVGFAHSQNPPIVHRDLKPANILVQRGQAGKVKLRVADFGIGGIAASGEGRTKLGTSLTGGMATVVRGSYTPLYASPQQMQGSPPDPRDDVYALGVIWYQVLTGDLTSGAPSGMQWATQLLKRGVEESQVQLLASCVEPRPEDRPPRAVELADRLRTLLQLPVLESEEDIPTLTAAVRPTNRSRWEVAQASSGDSGRLERSSGAGASSPRGKVSDRVHHLRLCDMLQELLQGYTAIQKAKRKTLAVILGVLVGVVLGFLGGRLVEQGGPGAIVTVVLLMFSLSILGAIAIKRVQQGIAEQKVEEMIDEIWDEYRSVLKSFGGEESLDNSTTVRELIRIFQKGE